MKNTKNILLSSLMLTYLSTIPLHAQEDNNLTKSKDMIILPYIFSSEGTGFTGGIGIIKQGLLQPQTTLAASVLYGAEQDIIINGEDDTANFSAAFLSFSNYKLPYTERLFFSLMGLKSYLPKSSYTLKNANDKEPNVPFVSSGKNDFFNTTFKYVLPIGEGLDNPRGLYDLQHGFAHGREGYGNGTPFITGRTSLSLKTFYQSASYENWADLSQFLEGAPTSTPEWNTNGLRLYLEHDNTDFDLNPSRGYHFSLQYSKDFGFNDSFQSWDFLEFKYNKYYNLDTFSFTKQNVLAFSFWTGHSFSWDNENTIVLGLDAHRTPIWEGARLGGLNRMRAYTSNRFSDKSVVYATAEYRAVLEYNPLRKDDYLPVAIDWFQVVAFVEAGQVNDEYNFDLLSDMKYDVGISLRAFAAQIPVRLDFAYGDEGSNIWVMIRQPFDF